jgi:UDP-glucose 4-epimerase
MRILVTGGSGFIGSHMIERFQDRAEIVVLDNLRTGKRSNLDLGGPRSPATEWPN